MALARTLSMALTGVAGSLIEVQADLSAGLPGLTFTGLADTSVTESRERIRAAVLNSGLSWPSQRITVALLPADVRKNGSVFDLGLAVADLFIGVHQRLGRLAGLLGLPVLPEQIAARGEEDEDRQHDPALPDQYLEILGQRAFGILLLQEMLERQP